MIKIAALACCGLMLSQTTPPMPAGHPPVPGMPENHPPILPQGHPEIMPPGHPPVNEAPAPIPAQPQETPAARPDDVKSIDAIIGAYYQTLSGGRGELRDWDRLRSLLMPQAHFITARAVDEVSMPMAFTVEEFIVMNRTYFERGGYFEREVNRHVDSFGNIAQAFSTYESRRDLREEQPYSRGINSIQLVFDGKRWWIANVMWDHERPDGPNPAQIPQEFQMKAANSSPASASSTQ